MNAQRTETSLFYSLKSPYIHITAWCKKTLPLFEFPALAAAWQTDQPMHSQSANFGKFKLNSLNLAGFFRSTLYGIRAKSEPLALLWSSSKLHPGHSETDSLLGRVRTDVEFAKMSRSLSLFICQDCFCTNYADTRPSWLWESFVHLTPVAFLGAKRAT